MEDLWDSIATAVVAFLRDGNVSNPPVNIDVDDDRVRRALSTLSFLAPVPAQRLMSALEAERARRESSSDIPPPQGVTRLMLPAELGSLVPTARCFMQGDEVYSMSEKPRGQCIIINNKKFEDPAKNRDGSEIDVERMEKLFSALYFEVHIGCNLTAAEMKKMLSEAAEAQSTRSDCLVVIIMSHGSGGRIEGTDGDCLCLTEDVYSRFNNQKCAALRGKPKVFFIQACRGQNHDNGSPAASGREDHDCNLPKSPGKSSTCGVSEESLNRMPSWTDILIAYATIQGHVAYRNPEEGSWFISSVYKVFRREAGTMHLQDMMRLVEEEVMKRSSPDGSKQTASSTTLGWVKKLYFNSGYFRERS